MQKQNSNNEPTSVGETHSGIWRLWSNTSARRVFKGTVGLSLLLALAACGGSGNNETASASNPTANAQMVGKSDAGASFPDADSPEVSSKINESGLAPDSLTDRFIIRYKDGTTERQATAAVQSKLDRPVRSYPSKARHLRRMGMGSDVVKTDRKLNWNEAKAFMRSIASDPDVEFVEPDAIMHTQMVPNDPHYSTQWGLTSNLKSGAAKMGIRAEGAWDIAQGSGSVIAIVDNGVTSHSDFNSNIVPGYDFTYSNRGANGRDPGVTTETCRASWHGTHVAGIAAALTNNGIGIAGVAPAAKVVPVRALDACGDGYMSDVTDGITWAAGGNIPTVPANANPAKIINVSLGGDGYCSATFQSAIDFATRQGAVVVTAAGNDSVDTKRFQPANCFNVIAVGATTTIGAKASFSNFGLAVDVAAPGSSIVSTYNTGTSAPGVEGYATLSGTSMAAPFVTGVVALAQSVAPTPLTFAEMRTLIQQNVQPFGSNTSTQPIGAGIIDATATVAAAKSGKIPAAADFTCSQAVNLMQVTCKDLSTSRGSVPIRSWAWDFGEGDDEFVRTNPVDPYTNFEYPGDYQIRLKVTDTNGATSTLTRPFSVLAPSSRTLIVDVPTPVSASSYEMRYYRLDVPAGLKSVTVKLTQKRANDGAWLYISKSPTVYKAYCQSGMGNGKPATCTIDNPAAAPYFVIVSGTTDIESSTIVATYAK
jgi:serine protease